MAIEYPVDYSYSGCCDWGTGTYVIDYNHPTPADGNGSFRGEIDSLSAQFGSTYSGGFIGHNGGLRAIGCGATWDVDYTTCDENIIIISAFNTGSGTHVYSRRLRIELISFPFGGARIYVERWINENSFSGYTKRHVQAGYIDWYCADNSYGTYTPYIRSSVDSNQFDCSNPIITVVN